MRPPVRSFEKGCTSRMRFEGSSATALDVPVVEGLSAGTDVVADEPFRARFVPVVIADGNALLVVVALVGLADDAAVGGANAGATPVTDSASMLEAAGELAALAAGGGL